MVDELTVKELQTKAEEKGIEQYLKPSGKNGKVYKKDYVKLLQKFYLLQKYGNKDNIPSNLKFRLSFESPQLCYQYAKYKKKEDRDEVWQDNNRVWLTEKIRGIRATLVYNPLENRVSIYSRHLQVDNLLPFDYNQNLNIRFNPKEVDYRIAIDVEIVLTDSELIDYMNKNSQILVNTKEEAITGLLNLEKRAMDDLIYDYYGYYTNRFATFYVLDVYYFKEDLRGKVYKDRYKFVEKIPSLLSPYMDIRKIPLVAESKKEFHEGIIKNGGEGTVAVYTDKSCNLTTSRRKYEWVKIKLSQITDQNVEDNYKYVDAFISDYTVNDEFGLIDSLTLSMKYYGDGNETYIEVVKLDSIPLNVRKKITSKTEFGITLSSDYDLQVVEFRTKGFIKKNFYINLNTFDYYENLFEKPHFVRFRDDKSYMECILDNYLA